MPRRDQQRLLREVGANFATIEYRLDVLFTGRHDFQRLPAWPETADALATSFAFEANSSSWSLTESSIVVQLMG
jgi:hypothetical protein